MSRNIRWRLQFKSLKGVGCLVNIYDEDWTSSADETKTGIDVPFAVEQGVTLLTGNDDPFYYEEDDDDDLLRVLRYKTGYINVVELTYGELSDLMPLTSTEHYVEFYYGTRKDFVGYMQAQSFENEWVAAPRILHFPVLSPLGLAAGKTLNVVNPPERRSLARVLGEVLNNLYSADNIVIMPDVTPTLAGTINSIVYCPPNNDFSPSIATSNVPYDPITYEEFLEGVCNCYGWMMHDTANGPVFTKFDHDGAYCSYTVPNLIRLYDKQVANPPATVKWALGNYVNVSDNDGKVSDILPVKKINLSFQGGWKTSASFDFNKLKYHSESHYSNNHAAWFTPVDGLLTGNQLLTAGNMFNTSNGYVTNYGATPALTGPVNGQYFCILTKVNPSWLSSQRLFSMQFANRPTAHGLRLKMRKTVGNRVSELVELTSATSWYNIGVKVEVDGQYYQGNGTWGSSANPYEAEEWDITDIPSGGDIYLHFHRAADVGSSPVELMAIQDIKLEEITEMYEEYKKMNDTDTSLSGAVGSDMEADVSMLFTFSREIANMVGDTVYPLPTQYPYLKTTQTRIQVPLKGTLPSNYYQPMYSYWLTGWRWRLIALAFHPWDDIYYLTLHRSTCLDSIAAEHMITVNGDHIDVTAPQYVHDGDYVQVTVLPQAGYALDYGVVMMGDEDITADCYDDGVISIEHVTDDVTITVYTVVSIPDYLCFTALESGTFTLTVPAAVTSTYLSYVEYSLDGQNWTRLTVDSTAQSITTPTVAAGGKVYWRGSGIRMGTSASNTATTDSIFTATGDFEVSGNIMSLLYGNSFDGVTSLPIGSEYTFAGLFYNNKKLLSIADLSLPATALVKGCYASMFYGCSNMTGMLSSLPATSYPMSACYMMFRLCSNIDAVPSLTFVSGNGGYQFQYMFDRCTSLVDASAIVMSASDTYSFSAMFTGCSALTVTPVMSLSTLKTGCFNIAFQGCTNLNYVKCLATDISATNCLNNWLDGVSSTGTFIQAEGVTWPRGASGIPAGWVDIEKRTMPSGYKQVLGIKRTSSDYGIDIGHAYNVKYSRLEVAFKQDEISNGMVLQTKDSVAGKVLLYNYQGSSLAEKPFSFYTSNASNTQRGGTIYSPLDTNPHTVEVSSDGSRGTLKHDGITTTSTFNFTDLPESCTSNPYLFGYNFYYYGWIYYFKEWDSSDVALSDFVSCIRENDNAVGFYDFVSQTFKTAANTSAFTAGEEI